MELHLLEKDKDSISVQIHNPNMTIVQPLLSELLEDEGVTEVRFKTGHPELDFPVLFVRVESGKPQTALKRAAKTLSNEFKAARELLEKSK